MFQSKRDVELNSGDVSLVGTILDRQQHLKSVEIYERRDGEPMLRKIFDNLVPREKKDKIQYIWGDFFEGPSNALLGVSSNKRYDFIFLGWILHDWPDKECKLILHKLKNYLMPGGQLVILDWILDDQKQGPVTMNDMDMLLQSEGRERTTSELSYLAAKVGLVVTDIIRPSIGRPASILKAQ